MDLIKVFITEDESIVREGLRDSIPWERYGFEFAGDAPDGEMALPMIRKLKPHILITDIKMPFMDGLSLSRIVSREFPDMKIIILSGYSDFEYARKAIEINVDQYLLKPITKASMIKALEQTRQKILEEQEQKDSLHRYEEEIEKLETYSKRSFFEALVEGRLSVQEIYEEAEKRNLNLDAEGFNFVVFTVQEGDGGAYSDAAEQVLDRILSSFLRFPGYNLFQCNLRSYAVLVKGSRTELAGLTERCVNTIQDLCLSSERKLNWYIAIGSPTDRLSGLPQCYSDVNHILAYRHLQPGQHILTPEILNAERERFNRRPQTFDAAKIDPVVIRSFVENGLSEETESFVKEFLSSLNGAENSVMLRHYLMMSARINAELALTEFGGDKEQFKAAVPMPDFNMPAADLKDYLVCVLRTAIDQRASLSLQRNNDLIEQAILFINRNYADENISLNSVAKRVNISSNYFSALFSQRVGMSFVEYLTQKRMDRAKQLLQTTAKRSGEIASEVGYHDPRYFSAVFKRTQGCTPSSYRNGEAEE